MQYNKSLKILKKVNSLFSHYSEDAPPTRLEIDLLKHYLVEMYDAITSQKKQDHADHDFRPVRKQSNVAKEIISKKTEPAPIPVVEEVRIEEKEVVVEPIQKVEEVEIAPKPEPIVEPVKEVQVTSPEWNALLSNIESDAHQSSHLGHKIKKTLTKSVGLNDKILFTKKLFNGDSNRMTEMITELDQAKSWDEAKSKIIQATEISQSWLSESNSEVTRKFLTLVHRQFSSN